MEEGWRGRATYPPRCVVENFAEHGSRPVPQRGHGVREEHAGTDLAHTKNLQKSAMEGTMIVLSLMKGSFQGGIQAQIVLSPEGEILCRQLIEAQGAGAEEVQRATEDLQRVDEHVLAEVIQEVLQEYKEGTATAGVFWSWMLEEPLPGFWAGAHMMFSIRRGAD
ncbi:MAG: hypothetical protein RML46_12705 [Anaerolineae bacterium]|nr:hypothetical protein [Anaerolineae bacterium]